MAMHTVMLVLSIIVAVFWLGFAINWFKFIKTIPIFRVFDNLHSNDTLYPSLSIIIPVCNEQTSIEKAVTSLLNQDYPNLELVVVNDRSTDDTGIILDKLKAQYPSLDIVTITELPPNWLGKNHAMHLGAKHANGEWLLFTDGDIVYSPNSLKRTVNYAIEHHLDNLVIMVDLFYGSFIYRAFLTFFACAYCFIVMMSKSAGCGAFNLIKRTVYDNVGGHEVISLQSIDDMSLGKQVVSKGFRQQLGFAGKGFIYVKWYNSLLDNIKGFEKNMFSSFNYNVLSVIVWCVFCFLIHIFPFAGLLIGSMPIRILCFISILCLFIPYNKLSEISDSSKSFILLHPISVLIFIWAIVNSMFKVLRRGGIEWRGTFYSIKELRKQTYKLI